MSNHLIMSNGLAIYRFGQGEPILFMPYPHAGWVVGDPIPTAIIEGLKQANRQVITFYPSFSISVYRM